MKKNLTTAAAFALAALASVSLAEKEGITFHKPISWTGPLDTADFENWDLQESSVVLQDKIILTPTGRDHYGFMRNLWTFSATHWEMSIDLDIDYQSERAEGGVAEFQIYLLMHEPEPLTQGQFKAFGQGLLGDTMKGFEIKVITMSKGKAYEPHGS